MVVHLGKGANGKSVYVEVQRGVLGEDYSAELSSHALVARAQNGPDLERTLVPIAGKRMLQSRLNPTIVFTSLLLFSPLASSQTNQGLIDVARNTFQLNVGIEIAGLFWIGCELAILFCMSVATCHLLAKTIPDTLVLTRRDKHIAVCFVAFFVLLCVSVFARHFFIDPLPDAISKILGQEGLSSRPYLLAELTSIL